MKDKDEIVDKIEKEKEVINPSNPSEWLKSLVEKNQEDTDFISMAHQTMQLLEKDTSKELTGKIANLEDENKNLKKKFYETFMGGVGSIEDEIETEIDEKTSLSLDELIKNI